MFPIEKEFKDIFSAKEEMSFPFGQIGEATHVWNLILLIIALIVCVFLFRIIWSWIRFLSSIYLFLKNIWTSNWRLLARIVDTRIKRADHRSTTRSLLTARIAGIRSHWKATDCGWASSILSIPSSRVRFLSSPLWLSRFMISIASTVWDPSLQSFRSFRPRIQLCP